MFKNKSKDALLISHHPISSQKIKNLIHLNDLKKLKKYSTINNNTNSNNNYNIYISSQCKKIFRKLANKYNRDAEYYNKKIITDIIDNEYSHLVATFKEYLIFGDYSEFLQDYFHMNEIQKYLPLIFEYYHSSTVIFPNYVSLEEKKYIYRNIQKKQQIINIQQEQEDQEKKKKNKNKEKKEKINDNDVINAESDSTSKSDVLTSHALNSILNQTNTSNNKKLFGINDNNNNTQDLIDFIEKIKKVEKKINMKNKNQKKRNKHIIAIHKGNNNLKKDNNKSNNTNTYNTLSTKNNTKAKEKSNIDTKSFSDRNIKSNYNLSSLNLNYNKNINKYFLLKLGQIKRRNEIKTTKNMLLELSSFNSSGKYKKMNFFANMNKKSQVLTEFCKGDKKYNNEKETSQNKKYNIKHGKRIKSYYGMNANNSRNKNIFCESALFSNNSNSSNKNIPKKNNSNFKVCSTLNNIHNDNILSSIDIEKKSKKFIPKKNRCIFDSNKIINVIYSKRAPLNTLKNSRNDSKKLITNKINKKHTNSKKKIIVPIEQKKSPNEKQKNFQFTTSVNDSKIPNPFEQRISPLYTKRNENKKYIKFALLSPKNISGKFSASRLIQKKQLNKNIQLNNKKLKLKKEINQKLKENKSNKVLIRKDFGEGSKYHFNTDFLTINNDPKIKGSPSLIDMKKSIDNKSIVNSIKNNIRYCRTKTLYNKIPEYYIKSQK